MKRHRVILILGISLMLLAGGSRYYFTGVSAAEDAAPSVVFVTIEGSAFSPQVVKVKAGTEVVWRNMDTAPHTVTADDGSFDSGTLAKGDEYKRKFTSAGKFKYSCDIHAYMSGTVEVE